MVWCGVTCVCGVHEGWEWRKKILHMDGCLWDPIKYYLFNLYFVFVGDDDDDDDDGGV